MTRPLSLAIAGAVLAAAQCAAMAQTTINRPIRLIVPYAPGGGTDTLARLLGPHIGEVFGQQVVIDNRPGGGSTIGTQMMARATPDGQTIGMVDSAFLINPGLLGKLPYDTLRDFAPVALVRSAPLVLLVNSATPAASVKELIAWAKSNPGKLTFGSAGNGSGIHLAGEQLRAATRLDIVHVPYKGAGPVITELLGGQITMAFTSVGIARPFVTAGRLRPLATTAAKRAPVMPEVPTFTEIGFPGVNSVTHNGLVAPAGVPADYVKRVNAAVVKAIRSREMIAKLPDLDYEAAGGTPEDFAGLIRTEVAKWQKLVKEAGIRVE
jgi:tripartite-type tricarboxylate transporter receptor subunit TctC